MTNIAKKNFNKFANENFAIKVESLNESSCMELHNQESLSAQKKKQKILNKKVIINDNHKVASIFNIA